jgi:hypothetical protein
MSAIDFVESTRIDSTNLTIEETVSKILEVIESGNHRGV